MPLILIPKGRRRSIIHAMRRIMIIQNWGLTKDENLDILYERFWQGRRRRTRRDGRVVDGAGLENQ